MSIPPPCAVDQVPDDMHTAREVATYVRTTDASAVIAAVSGVVGVLTVDDVGVDSVSLYTSGDIVLVLRDGADGFVDVAVYGSDAWPSSIAFARFLAKALHCTVRCDPGDAFPQVSPYSSVFLEIEEDMERLVDWGHQACG